MRLWRACEAEGGVLWALYDDLRPALVFGRGSGVEWEPMDGGAVPGEDGLESLGFGVAGDLGCDGLAVLVVQHFGEEADGCAGGAGVGVADDEGVFVLEEGEDGVHADPLRVSHELGEADGGVVFGVIGLGKWGVLRRPAGRAGDGAYADGEGGGAGECDGDDVGSARGAGVEAAEVPEFLDGLDAEVVDVLDVVHDLGEPEVPEVDGLGGRVFVVDAVMGPSGPVEEFGAWGVGPGGHGFVLVGGEPPVWLGASGLWVVGHGALLRWI